MPVRARLGTDEREFRCEQWDSMPPTKWGWVELFRDCRPDRINKNVGFPYANTDDVPNLDGRARNGCSIDDEYYVVLGNEVAGDEATLLDDREIPMASKQVHWNGGRVVHTDEVDTEASPETATAILEVASIESAFRLRPITRAQMFAISALPGMIVFVDDTFTDADGTINLRKHYGYDGTNWQAFY